MPYTFCGIAFVSKPLVPQNCESPHTTDHMFKHIALMPLIYILLIDTEHLLYIIYIQCIYYKNTSATLHSAV